MLDPKKVHIGIAPIAWTEDDMPEMGAGNSFLQTISEIALSGYTGTEIGCQYFIALIPQFLKMTRQKIPAVRRPAQPEVPDGFVRQTA